MKKGKRSLSWLRQHTNVEDLLDDGIANNSDLSSFATSDQSRGELPMASPDDLPPQSSHIEPKKSEPEPEGRDFYVAAIGALIIGVGLDLIFHPVDMIVYHLRATEHVTPGRSEFYGVVLILFGLVLLVYGLRKPRG